MGRLEKKLQRIEQENAAILAHLKQHGETRRSDLCRIYKIANISNRLRDLKESGHIKHEQRGLFQYWSLGKQVKHKKPFHRAQAPAPSPIFNLHDLPKHIQAMFGLIDFTPPKGRHIEETIYPQPLRKITHGIGSGTCAHIEVLANL